MDYVLPNELVDGRIAAGGKKSTVSVKNLLIRGFYSGAILGLAVILALTVGITVKAPFVGSLLCFAIGFYRYACPGDDATHCVVDDSGTTVEVPRGVTNAWLWPYFTDRGKIFVRHHFADHDVLDAVKKFANVLKSKGVRKGDTVTLYMPMVVELAVACLACARIGAIHSVVFGGFSPEAIRGRMADAQSKVVVTCDAVMRGAKPVQLKTQVDAALELGKDDFTVESVVVFRR